MKDLPFHQKVARGMFPERRRARFQRELAAHAEDAGTTETLGDPFVLRETFHEVTHARRTLIVGILFAILVCWCTYAIHFDETVYEQNFFFGLSMLIGVLLVVPVAPIALFLIVLPLDFLFGEQAFDWYFILLPILTSFIYTTLYFTWNYGPPKCLEWPRRKPQIPSSLTPTS